MQGGRSWDRAAKFYESMYAVSSMEASADRIGQTITEQPAENTVVVMAHNGPAGLGDQPYDICGRDWTRKAGKLLPPSQTEHRNVCVMGNALPSSVWSMWVSACNACKDCLCTVCRAFVMQSLVPQSCARVVTRFILPWAGFKQHSWHPIDCSYWSQRLSIV